MTLEEDLYLEMTDSSILEMTDSSMESSLMTDLIKETEGSSTTDSLSLTEQYSQIQYLLIRDSLSTDNPQIIDKLHS